MKFSPHLISAMQDAAVLTRLGFLPLGQKLIRISPAFALHSPDKPGSVNSPKYGNEVGGFASESHSLNKLRSLGSPQLRDDIGGIYLPYHGAGVRWSKGAFLRLWDARTYRNDSKAFQRQLRKFVRKVVPIRHDHSKAVLAIVRGESFD